MNYFHELACYDKIGVSYILKTCRLNRDYVSTANDIENDQHHNRIYFLTFSALNKLCWHELHSPQSTWHITGQLYTCFISKYSHCYGGLRYIMIKQNLPQHYRYKYLNWLYATFNAGESYDFLRSRHLGLGRTTTISIHLKHVSVD